MSFTKGILFLLLFFSLIGCKGVQDDLLPSGKDNRSNQESNTTETSLAELTLEDTAGNEVNILTKAQENKALVLYFTMWCPVCNSHSDHLRSKVIPNHPEVVFYLVDYLSGSLADALSSQESSGYQNFLTLVDLNDLLEERFSGTMSTTVVINAAGEVIMQEDFKDGARLEELLQGL